MTLKQRLPDFAKDIKVNLGKYVSDDDVEGLSQYQRYLIALACAYTTRSDVVIADLTDHVQDVLSETDQQAAKIAATIMAMNNTYYRFTHLVSDRQYAQLPAGLRMTLMAKSGVDALDFELMSMAVSAINGCGMCMDSHEQHLTQLGVSQSGIQTSVRIAAIVNASAQAVAIVCVIKR